MATTDPHSANQSFGCAPWQSSMQRRRDAVRGRSGSPERVKSDGGMLSLWRRRVKCDRRHVLVWCGSFWGREHLTIGDAHAVQNLSEQLDALGFEHCILSKSDWEFTSAPTVRAIRDLRDDIDSLTLVCGPLAEHPRLRQLMEKHHRARKIAVGVSVLANQMEFARSFDEILARDGTPDAAFDLAPARFANTSIAPDPARDQPIALCFVGKQAEYGAGRLSLDKQAEDRLMRSARRTGLPMRAVSTVLSGRHNRERQILGGFRTSQMIATTRLHGSLYALLNGRPVVAVDQIPGGAKVSDVLDRIGWPLVFRADQADDKLIDEAFEIARSGAVRTDVERARLEVISRSEAALRNAVDLIVNSRC